MTIAATVSRARGHVEASGAERARTVLLADIGGTNARFCLVENGVQGEVVYFKVAEHQHFSDAVELFLDGRKADRAAIAVAGPARHGRVAMTNSTWVVDAHELRGKLGIPVASVVNDFEALAWGVPYLRSDDLVGLGQSPDSPWQPDPTAPLAVVGPGTGLGVAGLVRHEGRAFVVPTEGGHVNAPSWCPRTDEIIAHLRHRFTHISAERLVSGQGLENLYRAIVELAGDEPAAEEFPGRAAPTSHRPDDDAASITRAAVDGTSPRAREALDLFCAMLGEVAGNVALTLGALGGVYIAGGIGPKILPQLQASDFRIRFESKGRFKAYLAPVPTWLITHSDATFLGLRALAGLEQSVEHFQPTGAA